MIEALPTESEVATAFLSFSGDIFTTEDSNRFLEIIDIDKPNACRFVSWLIGLRVIPGERVKWMPAIMKNLSNYQRCLTRYLGEFYMTPIETLRGNVAGPLRDQIESALPWFTKFYNAYRLPPDRIEDASIRVQRILSITIHDATGFDILEGFSHFVFLLYFVALTFSIRSGMPNIFAEACTYHMSRTFLGYVGFNRRLESMNVTDDRHDHLHKFAKKFARDAVREINKAGKTIDYFASSYERMLYIDQHAPMNLLLVWDHLILHLDDLWKYMNFLCIAHLEAMQFARVDFTSQESIYEMRWNGSWILDRTDEIIHESVHADDHQFLKAICPCYQFVQFFTGRMFKHKKE